jgi:hypothetical protein
MFWWNLTSLKNCQVWSCEVSSIECQVMSGVISWRLVCVCRPVSFCFWWEPDNPQCVWNLLLRRLLHIDCEITQTQAEALDMTRYDMWLLLSPLRIYFWIQLTQSKKDVVAQWNTDHPKTESSFQLQFKFQSWCSNVSYFDAFGWIESRAIAIGWPRPTQRVLSLADNVCVSDNGRFMVYHQWMMAVLVLKMAVNWFTVHIQGAHRYHVVRKK